jgi:hypothetical protein
MLWQGYLLIYPVGIACIDKEFEPVLHICHGPNNLMKFWTYWTYPGLQERWASVGIQLLTSTYCYAIIGSHILHASHAWSQASTKWADTRNIRHTYGTWSLQTTQKSLVFKFAFNKPQNIFILQNDGVIYLCAALKYPRFSRRGPIRSFTRNLFLAEPMAQAPKIILLPRTAKGWNGATWGLGIHTKLK